jgi:hypothetical protein
MRDRSAPPDVRKRSSISLYSSSSRPRFSESSLIFIDAPLAMPADARKRDVDMNKTYRKAAAEVKVNARNRA